MIIWLNGLKNNKYFKSLKQTDVNNKLRLYNILHISISACTKAWKESLWVILVEQAPVNETVLGPVGFYSG